MATEDLDGANLLILREGSQITLVVLGDKSYLGTLHVYKDPELGERWYITLASGEGEIEIHKRDVTVETDKKGS